MFPNQEPRQQTFSAEIELNPSTAQTGEFRATGEGRSQWVENYQEEIGKGTGSLAKLT